VSFTDRFSGRGGDYAAARPSYPEGAIDVLFDGLGEAAGVTAADLGAGTGISSRQLAARGALVLAVEPNQSMRDAAEAHPRVEWVAATAEHTGLDEASIDLAAAFQAFHWFDQPRALNEMVRILRPGGRAALVYNERDESDPFTAAYGDLVRKYATDDTERRRAHGIEVFESFDAWVARRRVEVRNEYALDLDGVLARARSTSYIPKEGTIADDLYGEIGALVARFANGGRIVMMMRTIVATADVGSG
jgi:SAM-dependent methyltransferase